MKTTPIYGLFVHLNNDAEPTCIESGSWKEMLVRAEEVPGSSIRRINGYGHDIESDE